jgi:AraC-like DNA-binding protein
MLKSALWRDAALSCLAKKPFRFLAGLRVRMEKGSYCPPHCHEGIEVVFHRKGSGRTRSGQISQPFDEGSVVVYGPSRMHDQTADRATEDHCVHIGIPSMAARILDEVLYVPAISSDRMLEDIQHLSNASATSDGIQQMLLDLRASALLLSLFQMASDAHEETSVPRPALLVRRAGQYLQEHFASIQSLSEVAAHLDIGYDYLRHIFKAEMGQSLVQFLNDVKIRRAKVLLRSAPVPLKQVATECGFRDEFYFSAVFRRLTGQSPGAFRSKDEEKPAKRIRA